MPPGGFGLRSFCFRYKDDVRLGLWVFVLAFRFLRDWLSSSSKRVSSAVCASRRPSFVSVLNIFFDVRFAVFVGLTHCVMGECVPPGGFGLRSFCFRYPEDVRLGLWVFVLVFRFLLDRLSWSSRRVTLAVFASRQPVKSTPFNTKPALHDASNHR